ncbi:DUF1194 domain-containing protein [Defluviimonas sp. WL0050]|uniref:DUF1194 domain-containing protein n=1 Tax=Albidovulum litorale TaxID=2984134 RepID=A0ABT2ZQP0_9RHOB|nr:DUF1194 domain-containing protein [Defluviimonas sp. WL0050]MCV2873443.1 DUF1194 domain-containing protein [Defluviimonas sp. WL0050]
MIRAGLAALLLAAAPAHAACRQALAIGLDVSGSVDQREFVLQVQGLAAALSSDAVRAVLLEAPGYPVALAVYDWSGAEHQRLILDWVEITDEVVLERVAGVIATAVRIERSPATGVGAAMLYGDALLAQRTDCPRAALDLTGDGLNNSGPQPRDIVLPGRVPDVTVNALVIGVNRDEGWDGGDPGVAELTAWFTAEVIRGPDAFVEVALGFEDFAAAMERKLLRELAELTVSALPGSDDKVALQYGDAVPGVSSAR